MVLGCAAGGWGQGKVAVAGAPEHGTPVAIEVDLGKTLGPFKPVYAWFGYDEANYTTMRNGVKSLRELHDLSPVPVYLRAHYLLTSGDGVKDKDYL